MDVNEAKRRILDAGKSGELTAAFQGLAEVTSSGGEPKYSRKICRALAQTIVCRTYAKPVLQLCHLVNAADALGHGVDRYERFFFGVGRATSGNFRAYVEDAVASRGWRRPGFECSAEGIVMRYGNGVFNVAYPRMPVLAALLEFLMVTEGYAEVDVIFAEMISDASNESAIGQAANAISRRIYGYLSQHLPSAQNAAKFHRILEFLRARRDDEALLVDDHAVLEFWRAHSISDDVTSGDFRAFRTVFDAFITFMRALDLANDRAALEWALSIGTGGETGEITPDAVSDFVDPPEEWHSPIPLLAEEPVCRVKFLNGREQDALRLLLDLGPLSRRLPLSLLRAEVFGKTQSRITQVLRRKGGGQELRDLICCANVETYADRRAGYASLHEHIHRVMKAALYALLRDRQRVAAGNVAALRPEDPIILFEQAVESRAEPAAGALEEHLEDACKAFRDLSRKGFDEAGLEDPDVVEGFRLGSGVLHAIARQVESFLGTLSRLDHESPGLAGSFRRDLEVFREQFGQIYGEAV